MEIWNLSFWQIFCRWEKKQIEEEREAEKTKQDRIRSHRIHQYAPEVASKFGHDFFYTISVRDLYI